MTSNDKMKSVRSTGHVLHSKIVSKRLLNLIVTAKAIDHLFVIFDECENEFGHREIHKLNLEEQRQLYLLSLDEIARKRMKKTWKLVNLRQRYLQ